MGQQEQQPLVSICIPTYNRCEYLNKSVESIICQPEFQNGKVEIVISDNASTDETCDMVSKYTSLYQNVRYYRNDKNIKAYNFPTVISLGKGKLRKLSGDTLIYKKGSLKYICDLVQRYERERPQLFFLNNMKKYEKEEFFCDSLDIFAEKIGFWSTWLGSFAIWDDKCANIKDDTKGCEMLLWHDQKIYDLVSESPRSVICNRKITHSLIVKNKDISYGVYKVFYEYHLSILQVYLDKGLLSVETFQSICKDLLYNFFTYYIINWERNHNKMLFSDQENLKKLVFDKYDSEPYWRNYLRYYKKQKVVFLVKDTIKTVLKKWRIWDILIVLHTK